jgi:4-aminobutyrate aminotransferase / (S)-3-amino-2-methylpropionate transaminase / 5-aminovalerate transaminase
LKRTRISSGRMVGKSTPDTRRSAVICFEHAFHGRSLLTLSLTSKANPYKAGFGPLVSDVYRIPYAYCYRCSYNLECPSCKVHCAEQLREFLKYEVSADSVAAIIAEPVLGEGGFVAPPDEFFKTVVEICQENGILFIAVPSDFEETRRSFGMP